jgi:hypothetical protein
MNGISVGAPVALKPTGLKGRVCRDMGFDQYCVQFEDLGCRRVARDSLEPADEPAPVCTPGCLSGC